MLSGRMRDCALRIPFIIGGCEDDVKVGWGIAQYYVAIRGQSFILGEIVPLDPWSEMIKDSIKAIIPHRLLIKDLGRPARPTVLLTFDDGPDSEITRPVLDRLDRYGARAIFFLVGRRVEESPELVTEIAERGHLLGNHTYSHFLNAEPGLMAYRRDLRRCQDVIQERSGQTPLFFRPPGGRLTAASILAPLTIGLQMMRWSIGCADYACQSAEQARSLAETLLAGIGNGDIILLHDLTEHSLTILDHLSGGLEVLRG